jgi:hypothetical protein
MSRSRVLFGCVAENNTKYLGQALRFVQSLRWFGGALAASDVIVCVVDACRPAYRSAIESLGAQVHLVARSSHWHGPSNKLQFLRVPEASYYDMVVLSDCDVVILDDITEVMLPDRLRAKPADFESLPQAVLLSLFERAGLPTPDWQLQTSIDGVRMLPYCNSGFLVFPRQVLAAFAPRWSALNAWCLAQRDLLGVHEFHCDQASFALALAEFGSVFDALPIEMNFPGHLAPARYPEALHDIVPRVLHYHQRVDGRTGGLAPIGLPGVDAAVARFNARLRRARQEQADFRNAIFWDQRYLEEPELGSGIGSRGEFAELKQRLVAAFVQRHAVDRLIDLGCGDCRWIRHVPVREYIGIDASTEVIERNRAALPGHRFMVAELGETDASAGHSLCFDVLIHQPTRAAYLDALAAVLRVTGEAGLINGFDREPTLVSDIVYYHEPLGESLARHGVELRQVGEYRDTSIFEWRKPANS